MWKSFLTPQTQEQNWLSSPVIDFRRAENRFQNKLVKKHILGSKNFCVKLSDIQLKIWLAWHLQVRHKAEGVTRDREKKQIFLILVLRKSCSH